MKLNYTEPFNFKPIPSITVASDYWQNGTWKFGSLEITPDTAYAPSAIEVTLSGLGALTLINALPDSLLSLKLFGGTELLPETYIDSVTAEGKCEQRNLPEGYTQVDGVTNIGTNYGTGYVDTGIVADVDDMEYDVVAKVNSNYTTSWYLLQSRSANSLPIYGISGSQNGNTFLGSFSGINVTAQNIIRQVDHTYHVNFKCENGNATLFVEDLTAGTNETRTGTYTFTAATTNTGLFSNINGSGTLTAQNTSVLSAYIKKSGVKVMDYVSCKDSNSTAGFYDKATSNFKGVSNSGGLSAGSNTVPSPTSAIDIVCNNGTIKAKMASGLPLGYTKVAYLESSGTQKIDTSVLIDLSKDFRIKCTVVNTSNNTRKIIFSNYNDQYSASTDIIFSLEFASSTQTGLTSNGMRVYCAKFNPSIVSYSKSTSALPLNTDIDIDFVYTASTNSYVLTCVAGGQTYTLSDTFGVTGSASVNQEMFLDHRAATTTIANPLRIKYLSFDDDTQSVNYIASKNSSNVLGMYDTVSNTFLTNQGTGTFTAGAVDDSLQIYTDGTTETITDNQGNVATCTNLLSVGSYKDTQEILSGAVSRNIGIKVLDGTENWEDYATGSGYAVTISDMISSKRGNYYCSHAQAVTGIADFGIAFGSSSGNNKIYWCQIMSLFATLTDFTNWLATQYSNGTPVIVVYPTSSATTSSVSGQVLNKTPLTYAGSVSGLTGTVVTSTHSVPSPTQPLQINCNNGVVKYGQYGKNLFNKSAIVSGARLNNNTAVGYEYGTTNKDFISDGSYYVSPLIEVVSGQTYYKNSPTEDAYHRAHYYNSDKLCTRISSSNTIEPTTGECYVAFCGLLTEVDTAQLELGSTATSYEPYHFGLHTDGRTETVEVHGKNLASAFQLGVITTEGVIQASTTRATNTDLIRVQPSQTYTFSVQGENYVLLNYATFDRNGTFIERVGTGGGTSKTVTFGSNVYYVRFDVRKTGNLTVSLSEFTTQLELGSTATTYEPYYDGGTATAQDLYAVGTYKDVQSVLDGAVTRNVGIKVFDGSENWFYRQSGPWLSNMYSTIITNMYAETVTVTTNRKTPYCTYFERSTNWITGSDRIGKCIAYKTSEDSDTSLLGLGYPNASDENLASFKQWLAQQYQVGNPVIVIYPLSTATTESVTGQALTTQEGANIVEITQASMDNLPLEVSYKAGVTVTITEVQNAQLDNSVEVTIQ